MKNDFLIIYAICTLLLCVPVLVNAENLIELPDTGTDVSNFRCDGNIISTGDPSRQVIEKCGEPIDQGSMPNRKYDIWVYHFKGTDFVYYLGFLNRNLQRIYSVSCIKNDPYCN